MMKNVIEFIALMLTVSMLIACGRMDAFEMSQTDPFEGKGDTEIITLSEKCSLEVLLEFATAIEDVVFISPSGKLYSKDLGNIVEVTFESYPEATVSDTVYAREDGSADNSMIYYIPDAEPGTWKFRCGLSDGNSVDCTAYPTM